MNILRQSEQSMGGGVGFSGVVQEKDKWALTF